MDKEDKDSFVCEFCQKSFKNQTTLFCHQTKTKNCLEKQGKEVISYKCEFCQKNLASKKRLETHLGVCKSKSISSVSKELEEKLMNDMEVQFEKKLNDKLKEQRYIYDEKIKYQEETIRKLELNIEKLQNTISSIAHKNTTTTTNNVVINSNQYLDLSKEHVGEIIEKHLTKDVVGQGVIGLANMVSTKLLKAEDGTVKYKCIDPSRQMFGYQNGEGEMVKDMKANKLTSALVQSGNLDKKARESGEELWTKDDGEIDYERFHIF